MNKTRVITAIGLGYVLAGLAIVLYAQQGSAEPDFSIRKSEQQTVLYTIYRGPYEAIGKPISDLYALAGREKMTPCGSLSLVYLNNPFHTSQDYTGQHCLTEIRIPVGQEAIQRAGTLGAMTDVKKLSSIEVAVMQKQVGQADYAAFFKNLYERIAKEGYRLADDAFEVFSGNMTGSDYTQMTGSDYTQIKAEVMVPVIKIGQSKESN